MLEILITSVNAVVPIILLILLGYFLKRCKFFNENFVKLGNKFVFNICLPCMLFLNIYDKMNSFADIPWDVVIYAVVGIFVIFSLGLVTCILTTKDGRRRGVILQCTFRSNFAIIGLALVERIGGDGAIAGIVSAFSIPIFNILAVISLSVFVKDGDAEKKSIGQSVKKILLNIIKNPLIIGVVTGLLFVAIREIEKVCTGGDLVFTFRGNLKFLYTAVSDLKAIASPLALVVLGAQFEFSAVKGMTKDIVVGTVWRIVIAPLIGIGGAYLLSEFTPILNFSNAVYPTLIALFGTPVAVSSAIMAGAMKNDEQLATQYVVWTSIGSIVSIFVIVFILMSTGLIAV